MTQLEQLRTLVVKCTTYQEVEKIVRFLEQIGEETRSLASAMNDWESYPFLFFNGIGRWVQLKGWKDASASVDYVLEEYSDLLP